MPKIRAMRVPCLVSVVIPNWNRKDLLQRCLRSVFTKAHRPLEVLVVDNASTDGSPELVRAEFPEVRLVRNADNVGASRARNQALVLARGEYTWFLDNDSVCPDPAVLGRMLAVLDADPGIGCVGGELFPDPHRVRRAACSSSAARSTRRRPRRRPRNRLRAFKFRYTHVRMIR